MVTYLEVVLLSLSKYTPLVLHDVKEKDVHEKHESNEKRIVYVFKLSCFFVPFVDIF